MIARLPGRRRLGIWWPMLALLAAAYIVGLSMHGGREAAGIAWFVPKGFLADREAADIRAVTVTRGDAALSLRRGPSGEWLRGGAGQALTADGAAKLDYAIKLLRVTAPERHIDREEMTGTKLQDFGMDRPSLGVTVEGPSMPRFSLVFGSLNPLGLSRYAQVTDRDGLWLLPKHVSDAWQQVAELQ